MILLVIFHFLSDYNYFLSIIYYYYFSRFVHTPGIHTNLESTLKHLLVITRVLGNNVHRGAISPDRSEG